MRLGARIASLLPLVTAVLASPPAPAWAAARTPEIIAVSAEAVQDTVVTAPSPASAQDRSLEGDRQESQEQEGEQESSERPFSGILPEAASSATVFFTDGRPPVTVRVLHRLGTSYLSDSDVSAVFGISLKVDPVLRLVAMSGRKGEANAVVGGTAAIVGDKVLNLPHPFLSESGRILLPLSFLTLGLPSLSSVSVSWDEKAGGLLALSDEPTVSGVTLGGRPGLARVTVTTARPLSYRVAEGTNDLALVLKGAVAESTFVVKGTSMSPLRDCVADWKGEELTLRFPLSGSARAFQAFREEYPQAIVLVVSTEPYRDGYDLEPLSRTFGGRIGGRTVVLDPAHGGDEWGAVGEGDVLEKDVVLEICKKAASILRRRLGINVYLTRGADHRMPPAGRAEMANIRGAAVFVSVHCDSWPGAGRRGYGAYVSPEPTLEGGYWEPQVERLGAEGAVEGGQGLLMKPWHQTQGKYGGESRKLASAIMGEMAKVHDGPALGIRRVGLVSLGGVDAPAVAVRCGFLSNKDDLKLLANADSRDRLAAALARGIEIYLGER